MGKLDGRHINTLKDVYLRNYACLQVLVNNSTYVHGKTAVCTYMYVKALLQVMYGKCNMKGGIRWQIQHEAFATRLHHVSAVFSIHHE